MDDEVEFGSEGFEDRKAMRCETIGDQAIRATSEAVMCEQDGAYYDRGFWSLKSQVKWLIRTVRCASTEE